MAEGPWTVSINLYDLSQGMAKQMSKAFIGKQIDGIWHTGIVVYGQEFYFGGGICADPPARTPYGQPMQNIPIGQTELPIEIFMEFLEENKEKFSMEKYDILKNNCNNFTDDCSQFLTGDPIPKYITGLPSEVLSTPMGGMIMNMVNGQQQQAQGNSHPLFSPSMVEGNNNQSSLFGGQGQTLGGGGASTMGQVVELKDKPHFTQVITGNKLVVIDVYTDWCGPCKAIKPLFATFPSKFAGIQFCKMNLDTGGRQVGSELGVQSIPTFLFYHNNQLVKKQEGANQQTLEANVRWLMSTYGSGSLTKPGGIDAQQQRMCAPLQKAPKGY